MLRTLDRPHQEAYSAHLEGLIHRLRNIDDPQRDLLIEHLTTACAYLVGGMPQEYDCNLRLAAEAAATLSDKTLRREVGDAISELLASAHPAKRQETWRHHEDVTHRPSTSVRPNLYSFFHGADHSFGVFYPKKHIVAVLQSYQLAEAARQQLTRAGFADHEVLAVSGGDVAQFLNHLQSDAGLWGELMTAVSRFIDTEACLVDRYAYWAKQGAGFLVVYCPIEAEVTRTAELLQPFEPLAAQWYTASYIRHLV